MPPSQQTDLRSLIVNKLLRFELESGKDLNAVYAVYFIPNGERFGTIFCDVWDWLFDDELSVGHSYNFDILSELTEFMRPLQEQAVKDLANHLDKTIS